MPKYHSGSYSITVFDQYGSKLQSAAAPSLSEGRRIGDDLIARGECYSYIIQRVIHNSLDNAWASKRSPEELDTIINAARAVV